MKTTLDIPEDIYRRVKAKSALEGRAVREVAISLFRSWVEQPDAPPVALDEDRPAAGEQPAPRWYAALRPYAHNAGGQYDMASIRRSIALGRAEKERPS